MSFFDELNKLQELIQHNKHLLDMRGISLGKVCYIDTEKRVKVKDINTKENYVTQWLKPSKNIENISLSDYVFYTYPKYDLNQGIYFLVVDSNSVSTPGNPGGITEAQAQTLIDTSINSYNSQIQQWTTNSFVTKSAFNTEHNKTQQSFFNAFRYISQLNLYTQGGDYAIPKSWINRCVNFIVNDTGYPNSAPQADYMPLPLLGTPIAVEYKNATFVDTKYRIICNPASMTNTPKDNDSMYIRNSSRFKLYVKGDGANVRVNGSATMEYLIPPVTQWKLMRVSLNEFTLSDFGFNNLPY